MSDRKFIYSKLIDALNEISFPEDEEETPKRKKEFLHARGQIRAELQEKREQYPKRRKSTLNMSQYKTHDGERGSTEKWRDAAKVILNVNGENCLETLGLSGRPATEDELKKVYRTAIRKAHPDAGGSEDKAARINAAYELALSLFFPKPTSTSSSKEKRKDTGLRPQLLTPIEEYDSTKYLEDDSWCAQEKKDGKHGMLKTIFENGKVSLVAANKQGLEMSIPKAIEESMLRLFGEQDAIFDGEQIEDRFYVFDILQWQNSDLTKYDYEMRYEILNQIFPNGQRDNIILVPCHFGTEAKMALYIKLKAEGKEGIVFKKRNALWSEGRPETGGDMVKCKFWATLSAIVSEEETGKASFSSYVLDPSGERIDLGRCSALGKVMPKAGDVVEIRYLYWHVGGKLIQPTLLSIRDDVAIEECTTKQLKAKCDEEKELGSSR